jgi:hypothetical protein
MNSDLFDFDGSLIEEIYDFLDGKLTALESQVDPDRPETSGRFGTIEHIYGLAAVAAQRYVSLSCKCLGMNKEKSLEIGPAIGSTSKISAIYAAANFWKHADEKVSNLNTNTKRPLETIGIDIESINSDETTYLVSNVFHRCGYSCLRQIIDDLKIWTKLMIEHTDNKI